MTSEQTPHIFPDTDKGWRDAIEEACVVSWVPITTPKETIQALLFFEQEIALDPQVSEAAANLVKKGAKEAEAIIIELRDRLKEANRNCEGGSGQPGISEYQIKSIGEDLMIDGYTYPIFDRVSKFLGETG